jgi:hypothetical protein
MQKSIPYAAMVVVLWSKLESSQVKGKAIFDPV